MHCDEESANVQEDLLPIFLKNISKKMFPQYLSNVKEALLAESRCLDTIVVLMLMQFNSYDYPLIDGTLCAEVPG